MPRRRRRRKPSAPREVTIESLSHEGRGIARIDGKTVFVSGALAGERVLIQVHRSNRNYDEAHALEVIEASPERIDPRCPFYPVCGGCSLQHLDNAQQLELKQQTLLEMLAHAGLGYRNLLPPLQGPAWGYRDKARLGVKYVAGKERVLVGFREALTPYITDMTSCEVLLPRVGRRLDALSELLGRLDARAQIPQIEVAADATGVQLVLRHLQPLSNHDLELLTEFGRHNDFMLQLQPAGPDSVHNLYPETQRLEFDPLGDGRLRIGFGALDFVQVNREINQKMVAQALELMALTPADRVLDLYCGLGNFTLPMALQGARVTGVEGDRAMVERARAAARANGIDNTEYHVADLNQPDPELDWMRARYDQVLLDPPRSGAAAIAAQIAGFRARRIVYVSCQPSSLVRDAAIICASGYDLEHIGVMDMFPQTAHVESMAVFESSSGDSR